ncbi:MAG: YihY/virulence factor BrkB family protein [Chloroflexota bacterium]|nr:YihY/virulence factor BrkB family protein [Chloroflexota bacterium]
MRERLAAFQQSKKGQFLTKVMDDRAPNLAVLLAWGTLNTLFPLVLGILAIAGFVLRDPQRLEQLTGTLFAVLPEQAATTLSGILTSTRESAGTASIISILLLLFSGSNFFANMQMVFNLAYHVPDRNFVMQRVLGVVMLVIVTALLLISTTAYGLGNLMGSLPIALPFGPVLGRIIGWSVSIVSAIVMFLLLYKILPNRPQGWKETLPGALTASVLFFVILQVFPLYVAIFGKTFQAYAAFGVFLLLMFWLYLLGLVLVIGAELNAFLEEPGRSTALAETASKAEKGQVELQQAGDKVETVATGSAGSGGQEPSPPSRQRRPLFGRAESPAQAAKTDSQPSAEAASDSAPSVGIGGRLIGLVGLLGAAFLVSRQPAAADARQKGQ